jgi:hypothetical protein
MAQSEPKKDQKLYPVYFGNIIGNNAGKEGVYNKCSCTNFTNDYDFIKYRF